jgi:filamentous hemagglutinin family protein
MKTFGSDSPWMSRLWRALYPLRLLGLAGLCGPAIAGPTGGQVTTGSGQITQSGTTTTIQQSSQVLGLNWLSFNVGANETVNFVQPGRNSIAVNQILSSSGSEILGHLNANGQVWLINPNGILFGSNAEVNVGGLVASTLAATATDGAGSTSFSGGGAGSIVNRGTLTAAKGGYVALLGNSVSNQGVVSAQLGTVAFGAGSAVTLSFAGNKLLQIEVDRSTLDALAENKGLIEADGGTVYMTAGAANSLLASTVNTSGVIRATSFENHDGTIVLSAGLPAGKVTVEGLLDVSSDQGVGGEVTATAGSVSVGANATVNASGGAGGGAIRIGGGWQGGEGLAQATTVQIADTATLNASATNQGNGGEIVVRSNVDDVNSTAQVAGTLLAQGGVNGGNGGRIETSGHWLDVTGISASASAPKGSSGEWLLDPYNVTIGSTTSGNTYNPPNFSPTSSDSTILASTIGTALFTGRHYGKQRNYQNER